ncbi:MAG: hypothetical protein IJP92_16830 [Lachnospiraceae bacterium]|nr:hypothetical protein [Lachnospiraceae bacterium]
MKDSRDGRAEGNKITRVSIIILVSLVLTAALFTFILTWIWKDPEKPSELYSLYIAVFSLVISLLALIYAMITYYSIDKVQSVNSMEGNILKDEHYCIANKQIIEAYEEQKDAESFCKALLKTLDYKKAKTCNELARELQEIMDNLIWFAYIDHKEQGTKKTLDGFLLRIDSDVNRFGNMNNGLEYLLKEYRKLIDAVFHYQQVKRENENVKLVQLENIRGKMFENKVTRTVYHNYLGLEYRSKAEALMSQVVSCSENSGGFFETKNLEVRKKGFADPEKREQRKQAEVLLSRAEESFLTAYELSKDDLLWNVYIEYNIARTLTMQYIVRGGEPGTKIREWLASAVDVRRRLIYLIWGEWIPDSYIPHHGNHEKDAAEWIDQDALNKNPSYLLQMFTEEYFRAAIIRRNIEAFLDACGTREPEHQEE